MTRTVTRGGDGRSLGVLRLTALAVLVGVSEAWLEGVARGIRGRRSADAVPEPARRLPTVTVIVPAWEERGTIERCLDALAHVDYPSWDVVVVAGGPDGTYEAAVEGAGALEHARVLRQQPLGKPSALNAGLAVASGEVVAILDADTVVDAGWLRGLVSPLVSPLAAPVGATTGSLLPARSTAVSRVELMTRVSVYDVRRAPILQGSGTIAVTRSLLVELGGFRVDAFADDWELDARLAELGIGRGYAPDARVRTDRPSTLPEFWRNELRWRRAHLVSLGRFRRHFFRSPLAGSRALYPYLAAWASVAGTALAAAALALGSGDVRRRTLAAWLLLAAGVVLRPVALPLEVAAFTRDARWLRDAWAPPALFVLTLAASCVASVTTRRATLQFKGPRRAG